jgi:hypothetical protein
VAAEFGDHADNGSWIGDDGIAWVGGRWYGELPKLYEESGDDRAHNNSGAWVGGDDRVLGENQSAASSGRKDS